MIEEENVDGAYACKKCGKVNKEEVAMNELPVIGSLHLPTDFWDRHGANINCNSLERNVWQKVVWMSKKAILERAYGFFATVLS